MSIARGWSVWFRLSRFAVLLLIPLLTLTALFGSVVPAVADNEPATLRVDDSSAQVTFGADRREIRFQLHAHSERPDDPIVAVQLLYQVDDSTIQNVVTPTFRPGAAVTALYVWQVNGGLTPGVTVRFQWELDTVAGRQLISPMQPVIYSDTRFNWREAKGSEISVYWNTADAQIGASILDEAQKTLDRLRADYNMVPSKPLRVYAYTRQQDYVSALSNGTDSLQAAMAFGTDRVFVLASDTQLSSLSKQGLRGEIASAVFRQLSSGPYGTPPQWLAEGFSLMLGGRDLSANDYTALGQMAGSNKLIPLQALSGNFPNNDQDRSLGYAESLSVVQYLYDTYGAQKMNAVYSAFKDGNTVDDALKKGLGQTLAQVESKWKAALKNGSLAKNAAKRAAAQKAGTTTATTTTGAATASTPADVPTGDGSFLDTMVSQPARYWQGTFGANTRWVVLGAGAFIGLGLVLLIGGSVIGMIRKANAE